MAKQKSNYLHFNNQQQIELSLESQVFLAFKHRTPNRRKLLKKLLRAGSPIEQLLSRKTKFISKNAVDIANAVLNKILAGESVLLNHKYLSEITYCKSSAQNNNIIKELANLFDIKYHSFLYRDGRFYRHHIEFTISTSILGELRNEGIENSEFYPKNISGPYTNNKDTFNKSIRSNESTFLDNSNSSILQPETSNFVEAKDEVVAKEVGTQATIHQLKPNTAQQSIKPANKRKKLTKAEYKAKRGKLLHFRQYDEPKSLADHYPLSAEDVSLLQSKSGREFGLNAQNEILQDMSNKPKLLGHAFPSKASFIAYMSKALASEKRNAVQINNTGFKIKANLTQEQLVEYTTLAQREAYLSEVEDRAITHRSDETQFRAKLVGTLAPSQAYNILSNIVAIEKRGEVFKIHLRSLTPISELTKSLILNQANAVGAYSGVERLELVSYVSHTGPVKW